jgi:hypothetical protein
VLVLESEVSTMESNMNAARAEAAELQRRLEEVRVRVLGVRFRAGAGGGICFGALGCMPAAWRLRA